MLKELDPHGHSSWVVGRRRCLGDVFDLCVTWDFWDPVYCHGSGEHNWPGRTHGLSLSKGRAFPRLPNDGICVCKILAFTLERWHEFKISWLNKMIFDIDDNHIAGVI